MTTTLRDVGGLSLAEAKACTDKVLAGETVTIDLASMDLAENLARRLVKLGAEAEAK